MARLSTPHVFLQAFFAMLCAVNAVVTLWGSLFSALRQSMVKSLADNVKAQTSDVTKRSRMDVIVHKDISSARRTRDLDTTTTALFFIFFNTSSQHEYHGVPWSARAALEELPGCVLGDSPGRVSIAFTVSSILWSSFRQSLTSTISVQANTTITTACHSDYQPREGQRQWRPGRSRRRSGRKDGR